MPAAKDVNPTKWKNIKILYDDGEYSICWGKYINASHNSMGVRWNGENEGHGFPSLGTTPLWHVEPDLTTEAILLTVIKTLCNLKSKREQEYLENAIQALKEFRNKMKKK